MKSVFSALGFLAVLSAPIGLQAQNNGGVGGLQGVTIQYAVQARGITVGTATYGYTFSGSTYRGTASHTLTGLARQLAGKRQDFTYSVSGVLTADGKPRPRTYRHQGGNRNRVVNVDFQDRAVITTSNPEMGMGVPPATPAQKLNTVDQVTMLAQMMLAQSDPCNQTVRVFLEGRTRFDLVMSPRGTQNVNIPGYRGVAQRCSVRFVPIAGFSDPMDAATLTFLFASTNGIFAPIQIQMPTDDAGIVRLDARRLTINGSR
jgi:Protein of unknown function (DUF3108)